MERFFSSAISCIKKEPVLFASGLCALISAFFVPPSTAYLDYVDFRVLCQLFCLMVVIAGFQECGVFTALARRLLTGKKRLSLLFLFLVLLPFFSSMLITNDVALITFVPFTILILKLIHQENDMIRIIVFQTLAANLGSMATPVGNPQNLFLYSYFGLSFRDFFHSMLPLTLLSLFLLCAASVFVERKTIRVTFPEGAVTAGPGRLALFFVLFFLCLLSVFRVLPYGYLTLIVVLALTLFGRSLFAQVDYGLLLTFLFFFIFSGNIGQIGPVRVFLTEIMGQSTLLASILASQVISNVPAAVLLADFTQDWHGLLLGTNIGGLGTPVASLASLISLKFYMQSENSRPDRYLVFFLLANAVGLVILLLSLLT